MTVESAFDGKVRMCGTGGKLAIGLKMIKGKYTNVTVMKQKLMEHLGHKDPRAFMEILKNDPSNPTRPSAASSVVIALWARVISP